MATGGLHRRVLSLDGSAEPPSVTPVEVVQLPLVSGPLLVVASAAGVWILVYFAGALLCFVFAIFAVYLLRPLVLMLHTSPSTVFRALANNRFRRLSSVRFCHCSSHVDDLDWASEPLHAPHGSPGEGDAKHDLSDSPPSVGGESEQGWTPEMDGCKMPYWLAVVLALCIFCAVFVLLVWACTLDVGAFAKRIDVYSHEAKIIYRAVRDWFLERNIKLDDLWPKLEPMVESLAEGLVLDIFVFLGSFVVVVIFTVYLLLVKHDYRAGGLQDRINFQVQRYIFLKVPPAPPAAEGVCQCMICLLEGGLVGLFFWILGTDLAFFWGCNWVPNLGSIVATLLPVPLVALDYTVTVAGSHIAAVVLAFALPTVIHQTIGNWLEPRIFGNEFDLHPVVVPLHPSWPESD